MAARLAGRTHRPFWVYLAVVLLVAASVTGVRQVWSLTVKLGCLPEGGQATADSWLDNCDSGNIGDYAHSAVWFGLEPAVTKALLGAKVLIFGDSRMLSAMSEFSPGSTANPVVLAQSTMVSRWFAAQHVPYYLLAFSYGEQSGWAQNLFAKLPLHPAVMIFDTAPYFTGGQSLPAQAIQDDPDGELKTALATRAFLAGSATTCSYAGWLCGRTASNYRAYQDGHEFAPAPERVWFGRRKVGNFPLTTPPPADTAKFEAYLANTRALLLAAKVDARCAVFTTVPNSDMDSSLAHFLAARLGGHAITPVLSDLASVDHWHLTLASAQAWTGAFLDQLQPVLQACAGATAP